MLIDAENIASSLSEKIFECADSWGSVRTKRIFGNFSSPTMFGWRAPIMKHGVSAQQHFNAKGGKNSSDVALVIEAMDVIHTRNFDGIIIVSNDCDFAPLAIRIKDAGLLAYGIGCANASQSLVDACDNYQRLIHGTINSHHINKQRKTLAKKAA